VRSTEAATGAEAQAGLVGWAPELQKAKVYEQILLDVILGKLAPGSRLDEQALALRYDAGLAGVRDALGRLALEGLVVRKPRAGTTVAPLDLLDVRQDFEARRLIEPHCAALAAQNATAADIAALRRAFDGCEAAARDGDKSASASHAATPRPRGRRCWTSWGRSCTAASWPAARTTCGQAGDRHAIADSFEARAGACRRIRPRPRLVGRRPSRRPHANA